MPKQNKLPKNKQLKQNKLPQQDKKPKQNKLSNGLRCIIYSYLNVLEILEKVSKISKGERLMIATSKLINHERNMKLFADKTTTMDFDKFSYQITYAFKIIKSCQINFAKMRFNE